MPFAIDTKIENKFHLSVEFTQLSLITSISLHKDVSQHKYVYTKTTSLQNVSSKARIIIEILNEKFCIFMTLDA